MQIKIKKSPIDSTVMMLYTEDRKGKATLWATVHEDFLLDWGSVFHEGTPLDLIQNEDATMLFNLTLQGEDKSR